MKPFLYNQQNVVYLITTRNKKLIAALDIEVAAVEVGAMSDDEAVKLLRAELPEDIGGEVKQQFEELAERLHNWPLLLGIANGWLRNQIPNYKGSLLDALKDYRKRIVYQGISAVRNDAAEKRKRGLGETLQVSLNTLEPAEQERYKQLGVFPENIVPAEVLSELWETGEVETEDQIIRFADLSLLHWQADEKIVRLHPLIHEYLATTFDVVCKDARDNLLKRWREEPPHLFAWQHLIYLMVQNEEYQGAYEKLVDINWMKRKLRKTDINALIADHSTLLDSNSLSGEEKETLQTIQHAIRISSHLALPLSSDRDEYVEQFFPSQLYSRLPTVSRGLVIEELRKQIEESLGHSLLPLHGNAVYGTDSPLIDSLFLPQESATYTHLTTWDSTTLLVVSKNTVWSCDRTQRTFYEIGEEHDDICALAVDPSRRRSEQRHCLAFHCEEGGRKDQHYFPILVYNYVFSKFGCFSAT